MQQNFLARAGQMARAPFPSIEDSPVGDQRLSHHLLGRWPIHLPFIAPKDPLPGDADFTRHNAFKNVQLLILFNTTTTIIMLNTLGTSSPASMPVLSSAWRAKLMSQIIAAVVTANRGIRRR